MNGVSCLCLTYGRPHLLEEAIHSFLIQDYAGPKELIVVNDHPDQTLTFEHPDVTIVNLPRRIRTLGEKRNLSVALARYDYLFVWDDDDIYLPWRISETMKVLPAQHFYKCPNAWVLNDGKITELGYNLFHSGSAFDRWLFERAGGYKPMNGGEDADIELRFQHVTETPAEFWKHTILPHDRVFYMYRWSHGSYHTTGVTDMTHIAPDVAAGEIALHPQWRQPYDELAAKQVASERDAEGGERRISFLCFSKDRPLQLDAYVRSFARHVSQGSLTVLYRASSPEFEEAYQELRVSYPWVRFETESNFRSDVQRIVSSIESRYLCFGVDDAVFVRPVDVDVVLAAMDQPQSFAFSLRLGRNITRSMFIGPQTLPEITTSADGTLAWDLERSHHCGDWGYSWELCGTVYPAWIAKAVVERVSAPSPNTLEAGGGGAWSVLTSARIMHCFAESTLIVPTVNVVQHDFANGFLGNGITTAELLERWNAGVRVDLDACERIVTDQIHVADLFLTDGSMLSGAASASVAASIPSVSMSGQSHDYLSVCRNAAQQPEAFANFRRHPGYTAILEHVSEDLGRQCLQLLSAGGRARASLATLAEGDHLGNPHMITVEPGIRISPTLLRYLKVADDLEQLFGSLDGLDVIEIGVGYGGQCRVLDALFTLGSYTLVDLREPLDLASAFLGKFATRCSLRFATMDELTPRAHGLCVSNFAFSELSRPLQDRYCDLAIDQAERGYMTCNAIAPPEYRPMTIDELASRTRGRILPETPLSFPGNCVVVWGPDGRPAPRQAAV